jgi:hypothetical protein
MNKIVASVGLVALGAAGVQAAVPGFTGDGPKPWSVSATLRGFYDDNINTVSSHDANKQGTFGFEVSPTIALAWSLEQTALSFSYTYSLKGYEHKPVFNSSSFDQTHAFLALLDHTFSERYHLNVRDSFVIGQEPDFLRTGNAFTTFQRISGDNIRNYGAITFDAQLTPRLGLEAGYANSYFDYKDEGATPVFDPFFGSLIAVEPSRSGVLDRIEHTLHLDARLTIQPQTIGVIGYQFRQVNYTADEPIGILASGRVIFSDNRDYREHYGYVGVDHTFRPDLTGSVRVGARATDYYNDPSSSGLSWGPYAMASLKWTYALESYVEAGLSHDMNATDLVGVSGESFTTDEQSTTIFANLHHRITPKLFANLVGQFQNSSFRGGSLDSDSERYYLVGINAQYRFTPHFSGEVGYNYDRVDSDVAGRSFDRNRVYIGVTASY